jgi:hypothetical protein
VGKSFDIKIRKGTSPFPYPKNLFRGGLKWIVID